MSRFWVEPWHVLDATGALDIVIAHQDEYLQFGGEPFYLLQRRYDSDRVVKTLGNYDLDPDVRLPRTVIWHEERDPPEEFPDSEGFEATLTTSFGAIELTQIQDKDTFSPNAAQFSLDFQARRVDASDNPLPGVVYLILNAPPHNGTDPVHVLYRWISPATDFHSRQPVVDNFPSKETSLRGYRQFLDPKRLFRGVTAPHIIPLALPAEPGDLSVQPAGMTRASRIEWWTSVPPFTPVILEHDLLVRAANNAYYEVVMNELDWGLGFANGQSRLKSQKFTAVLLEENDPRTKIPVVRT